MAPVTYARFEHIESGIIETCYLVGSEGALRLASDEEWQELEPFTADAEDGDGEAVEVRVSDAAAKLAEEHGIDLSEVEGTGSGGSITKGDVLAAIEAAEEDDSEDGDGEDSDEE